MKRQIDALQASQADAEKEIAYLRSNQDRVVHKVSAEFRQLKREFIALSKELEEMKESHTKFGKQTPLGEADDAVLGVASSSLSITGNGTPISSQSRLRRVELKRQGAFLGGDINNLPWDEMNDVRGFNPDKPRYYWSSAVPPMSTHTSKKRARDDNDSAPLSEQVEKKVHFEDEEAPMKRRKIVLQKSRTRRTVPFRAGSAFSRPATPQSDVKNLRRSTSFIVDIIAGVSSAFRS